MELAIRETTAADLDFVLAAERAPEAAALVGQWPRERHLEAVESPGEDHLLIILEGRAAGYAILQGLADESGSIEIRRIVVTAPGRGIGRRALRLIVDRAFLRHGAHRVWLDTFVSNLRAQRAYAAVGFTREGVLREALFKNGRHESLVVMSILRSEWPSVAPSTPR